MLSFIDWCQTLVDDLLARHYSYCPYPGRFVLQPITLQPVAVVLPAASGRMPEQVPPTQQYFELPEASFYSPVTLQ